MKTTPVLLSLMSILMTGCFAPINLSYESAKTLNKGQVEVRGMYSRYNVMNDTLETALINQNYGLSVGYGFTDKYTIKARYEYISPTITFQKVFDEINEEFNEMNSMSYFEIDNKLMLINNTLSLSLPLGAYFYNTNAVDIKNGGMGWFSFDPRVYLSFFRKTDIFELTLVPKLHVLFGSFGAYVTPGISLGAGFSSDLDRWSIRPEIGYDRFLSFGIGASVNFNTVKQGSK